VHTVEKNQKAFTGFSSDGDTYADAGELAWMLEELPVLPDAEALDIATGTGEFARALSPMVGAVVGLDATDAMLEQGKKFVEKAGIKNISFKQGIVQDMPFGDASFDIVSCRYAFHHFADPKSVISEMVRVCKPGGHIIIVDIIIPDESTAVENNYYEWLCDQSHTRVLRRKQLLRVALRPISYAGPSSWGIRNLLSALWNGSDIRAIPGSRERIRRMDGFFSYREATS